MRLAFVHLSIPAGNEGAFNYSGILPLYPCSFRESDKCNVINAFSAIVLYNRISRKCVESEISGYTLHLDQSFFHETGLET